MPHVRRTLTRRLAACAFVGLAGVLVGVGLSLGPGVTLGPTPVVVLILIGTVWIGSIATHWSTMRRLRREFRAAHGRMCTQCGYNLKDLPDRGGCPECGHPHDAEVDAKAWGRAGFLVLRPDEPPASPPG